MLPEGLARIIRHCLEKSPDERFQSARDLAFDLASLTGGATTSGRAFSPDGDKVAYRSGCEGGGIFVMGACGESGEAPDRLWLRPGLVSRRHLGDDAAVKSARYCPDPPPFRYLSSSESVESSSQDFSSIVAESVSMVFQSW